MEDFEKRSNNDKILSRAVIHSFSELEKKLLDTHQVVTVRGKRGRAVPILIPPECILPMTKLTNKDYRKAAGVKASNPYLFANTGKKYHIGCDL